MTGDKMPKPRRKRTGEAYDTEPLKAAVVSPAPAPISAPVVQAEAEDEGGEEYSKIAVRIHPPMWRTVKLYMAEYGQHGFSTPTHFARVALHEFFARNGVKVEVHADAGAHAKQVDGTYVGLAHRPETFSGPTAKEPVKLMNIGIYHDAQRAMDRYAAEDPSGNVGNRAALFRLAMAEKLDREGFNT